MRKAFRHSGVLMMVAVVALGLLGAAYTLWYEDLTITTNVETGTLNADVSIHPYVSAVGNVVTWGAAETEEGSYPGAGRPVVITCPAPLPGGLHSAGTLMLDVIAGLGNPGPVYGCTGGGFPAGKPPTVCNAAIASIDAANDTGDNNHLILNLSGLYPFAGCQFQTDVHNVGSVPIHITLDLDASTYELCEINDTGCVDLDIADPAISVLQSCTGPGGTSAMTLAQLAASGGRLLYKAGPGGRKTGHIHPQQRPL